MVFIQLVTGTDLCWDEVVEPANIHDSQVFTTLFQQVKERVAKPHTVAVDAGYKTPVIAKI